MVLDTSAPRALKVVLLGEDALAREGLAGRLAATGQVTVLAQQSTGAGKQGWRQAGHDAVVWDVGSQEGEDVSLLRTAPPAVPWVTLVADAATGAEANHAGAQGVLYRDASSAALLAVLNAVSLGFSVVPRDVMEEVRAERPHHPEGGLGPEEGAPLVEQLTPREHEVLALLVDGLSNKGIGARLGISEHTAKFHVTAVMQKLGVQRRTEVVARAARLGWVVL
jgi:two-component system nitrate/nitrite response regulator NarL